MIDGYFVFILRFQPFSQFQVCKTDVPKMPLPTTQTLSNSMVSPQKQLMPIETQEEAPPTEYRVLRNSNQDKYVMYDNVFFYRFYYSLIYSDLHVCDCSLPPTEYWFMLI